MKRWGKAFAVAFLVQLLTGCFVVGARTPGDLMQTPSLKTNQQSIKDTVNENLMADEVLYRPGNSESLSAINFVDLDGDGKEESVVFYKNSKSYRLGAYVFRFDEGIWKLVSKIESSGVDIAYSRFEDLTGDGNKEIVMAWSADKLDVFLNKYMTVYSYGERVEELYGDAYTEMATGDFDGNGSMEMMLMKLNRNVENPSSTGELVVFEDGGFRVVDEIVLDPYINGYYNVLVGNASRDRKGIFLDMGVGAHSAATYLLVVEDGTIINVFNSHGSGLYSKTLKPYSIESQDVDGDGIVEIGMFEEPYGNTRPASATPWIANWYQWDGEDSLNRVMQNYVSISENIRIDFPDEWVNRVTLKYPDDKPGMLEIGFADVQNGKVYPLYMIHKIREDSLAEGTEHLENSYFTALRMNGSVFVVEKCHESEATPYSIRQEYMETVIDDEEIDAMIKKWR